MRLIKLAMFSLSFICVIMISGCNNVQDQTIAYKYYTQEQLKSEIGDESSVIILDIQVKEEFDAHHIDGAIPTYAFPVKSDEDKSKLDSKFEQLSNTDGHIVIICPKGLVGAERTYDHLLQKGIEVERLFILEGGQAAWSLDEPVEAELEENPNSNDT